MILPTWADSASIPACVLLLLPSTGEPVTSPQTLLTACLKLFCSTKLNASYYLEMGQVPQIQALESRLPHLNHLITPHEYREKKILEITEMKSSVNEKVRLSAFC